MTCFGTNEVISFNGTLAKKRWSDILHRNTSRQAFIRLWATSWIEGTVPSSLLKKMLTKSCGKPCEEVSQHDWKEPQWHRLSIVGLDYWSFELLALLLAHVQSAFRTRGILFEFKCENLNATRSHQTKCQRLRPLRPRFHGRPWKRWIGSKQRSTDELCNGIDMWPQAEPSIFISTDAWKKFIELIAAVMQYLAHRQTPWSKITFPACKWPYGICLDWRYIIPCHQSQHK